MKIGSKNISPFIILIIIIAIIGVLFLFLTSSNSNQETLSIGNSPVLGDINAPVTIYEFSDFSCPFCAAAEGKNEQYMNALKSRNPGWEAPMPLVKDRYVKTGKVKIVFKYFPGHGEAGAAHAVALGLNEQNPELFWKFAEKAFEEQQNLNNINRMKEWASELGANMNKLDIYINSKAYEFQLREDTQMGKDNNIGGTPTFFINGKVLSGAQSFSEFEKIIESELR